MKTLARAAQHLGGAVFLALFGVFIVQITARFLFAKPLPWTDELAVVLPSPFSYSGSRCVATGNAATLSRVSEPNRMSREAVLAGFDAIAVLPRLS
jgi:hypothetical protein